MFGIFRKTVTVKRTSAGGYVNGFWVDGTVSTVTIKASVQPANGKDVQLLPEGDRLKGAYKLFTDSALIVAAEGGTAVSDLVVIGGDDYQVRTPAIWDNGILPHNEYICVRVQ